MRKQIRIKICGKRVISLVLAGILAVMPAMSVTAGEVTPDKAAGKGEQEDPAQEPAGEQAEEITTVEEASNTIADYDDEDTEWEEIYLDSAEDMKQFSRDCWLDTWSINKKVYLTKDIDLSGSDFVSIPTFGGYFDGQGHTVSGLVVRDSLSYTGMFCYTQQSAVIANLKVQGNVSPSGKSMVVGGIVGDNSGIIISCDYKGVVEGSDYVGGITGFNEQSGILIDCTADGTVRGAHYTGGIVGENTGNIAGCVNKADVNVSNEDKAMSLEDINLEQYASGLLETESSDGKTDKASTINNTIDSGGIAGLSTGIIQYSSNSGTVGYEHVGYNTGGIVGRQSGYVYACENNGTVYGRKDVGGIAGQTEPYIAVDLSEDIAYQLSENIDKLHDLTGEMLNDAGTESDTVSARLTVIRDFVDKALNDTGFLADRTVEWTDGMVSSANDLMGRVDYIMDETGRNGGFIDQTRNAAGNVRDAAAQLGNTVEALDIYQYMTEEEKARYEEARAWMENASRQYAEDYAEALEAYRNYYIDKVRSENGNYTRSTAFSLYVNTGNEGAEHGRDETAADPDGADYGIADNNAGAGSNGNGDKGGMTGDNTGSDGSGSTGGVTGDDTGNDGNGSTDGVTGDGAGSDGSGSAGEATGDGTGNGGNGSTGGVIGDSTGSDGNDGTGSGAEGDTTDNVTGEEDIDGDTGDKTADSTGASDSSDTFGGSNPADRRSVSEKDLRPLFNDVVRADWTWDANKGDYRNYIGMNGWVHYSKDANGLETTTPFPQSDGEQGELDRQLLSDVAKEMSDPVNAARIETDVRSYADEKYMAAHPASPGYEQDMRDYLQTMSSIALTAGEKMSEEARARLQSAVGSVEEAMGNLESAGGEVKSLFDTVNGMPDLQMPQLGSDYRSRVGSLNANLQGLSENMGHLNEEMSSTNDVMLADLSKINDQFSMIMRLYTDAIDGVLDMDYSTVYEDNSQEDAESSTDATIADCTNAGTVRGDLNVSGIAGTMAIEYDFDLEGDVTGIENARLNSTFLTKCVLRHNINDGNVTAQKSYAGGIAGLQEMGTILRCENYGRIDSIAGNYVGGIAGQSLSNITNGYAKCTVSGEEYVAGIAGSGSGMEHCCAMVRVQDASAFYGAIAGDVDSSGTVTGNYFVSDEIAGIDRISYSGKAEPVSYEELLETEGLPGRFQMMSVVFYADEEEVKRLQCPYKSDVSSKLYPDIPAREGFYADWDIREIPGILYDEDVTAEYVRYLTTLASAQTRENGQSVLLVDGMFKQEAEFLVDGGDIAQDGDANAETGIDDTAIPLKNVTEHWKITIPEDENGQHQLRYQAPLGQTEGVALYVKRNGTWQQADTKLMGIYHLFTVEDTEVEIAVCIQDSRLKEYLLYGIPAALVVVVVLVLCVRKSNKRKKDRKEKNEEKRKNV